MAISDPEHARSIGAIGRALEERLPRWLLVEGPRGLALWQWVALPVLVVLSWAAGRVLAWVTRRLLGRVFARTRNTWDDALLARMRGPLTLLWSLAVLFVATPILSLDEEAQGFVRQLLRAGFLAALFWGASRSVDLAAEVIDRSGWAQPRPAVRALLPIGTKVGKVATVVLAVIAVLSELGYPVASLIAGLGIGGLAVALAAQKTVENLFGSVAISVDRPIRVGDFVRVEDFVGTVEEIGLRSTRIRTLDRTTISIPNGKLADMRLETFATRDRMRLACTVGLVYGTTAAQLRAVLAGIEGVLRAHPRIWPDTVVVRFKEFGASSLDIEVMAWFVTPEWSEFQLMRQEVLIGFMEVVERAGSSFAFPTRTVHLVAPESGLPDTGVAGTGAAEGTATRGS